MMNHLYANFDPNALPFIDSEADAQTEHDFEVGNVVSVDCRTSRNRLIVHKDQRFQVKALIGVDQLHVKYLLTKKEWSCYNHEFTAHFSHFVRYR